MPDVLHESFCAEDLNSNSSIDPAFQRRMRAPCKEPQNRKGTHGTMSWTSKVPKNTSLYPKVRAQGPIFGYFGGPEKRADAAGMSSHGCPSVVVALILALVGPRLVAARDFETP